MVSPHSEPVELRTMRCGSASSFDRLRMRQGGLLYLHPFPSPPVGEGAPLGADEGVSRGNDLMAGKAAKSGPAL